MVSPSSDPLIGKRLGEYEVLERIGEGGMGVVYRGLQPIIKKRVAIKVLKPHAAGDHVAVQRLIDEAEAVNSIRHRGIIDIFSLGRLPDGRPYIVMEFLEGQPLDVYLASNPVPLNDALTLIAAICSPLGAAHRAKVVHRDLKPSNVFICMSDGERYLKLLDFGIAKKGGDGSSDISKVQRVIGTPNYMAPEQARGETVGPTTDLYALGVMAFEMVTGHLPYRATQPLDVIMAHLSDPVPSARELAPMLSEGLDELLQRLLAKDPAERPQSADEVRQALMALSSQVTISNGLQLRHPPTDENPPPGRSRPPVDPPLLSPRSTLERKQKTTRWLVGAVAVLALAVCATFVVGGDEEVTEQPTFDAGVAVIETVDAGAAPAVVEPDQVEPDAGAPEAPVDAGAVAQLEPTSPRPRPTLSPEEALPQPIARLEKRPRANAQGEEPDPAAMGLLKKYRVEAVTPQSPAERKQLSRTLDEFERAFFPR